MFRNIAYYLIFGKPLIMYLGILTFCLLIFTALVGYMNLHGKTIIPLKWHFRLAKTTVVLAIIHGSLGILAYFF